MKALFSLPLIGSRLRRRAIEKEGGEKTSAILRWEAKAYCAVEVGLFSYGGCFHPGFNRGGAGVFVGRYCSIAEGVHFFGASHPVGAAVMSPFFYNRKFGGFDVLDVDRSTLHIGHDVWIGCNTIITAGCSMIGNGAVVGAGSVVTHDVPPYAIVAGNPAKLIRMRFNEKTVEAMESSLWWELSPEELYKFYTVMDQPDTFAEVVRNFMVAGR